MPARPRTAAKAAAAVVAVPAVPQWDVYVSEVKKDLKPWRMQLPDGEILEVDCPVSDKLDELSQAQLRGDSMGMLVAVFGADTATKLMRLTAGEPWPVRLRLVDDVMIHFGMSLANLPQS